MARISTVAHFAGSKSRISSATFSASVKLFAFKALSSLWSNVSACA